MQHNYQSAPHETKCARNRIKRTGRDQTPHFTSGVTRLGRRMGGTVGDLLIYPQQERGVWSRRLLESSRATLGYPVESGRTC